MRSRFQPRDRRGTAAVELALVFPVFMLIVFGIVEFGRAFMVSEVLTSAAREGARLASMSGSTNAEVTQAAKDLVHAGLGVDQGVVNVTIAVTPASGNPDPGNNVANARTRDVCSVTVQLPYDAVSFMVADFLKGQTLAGHCAMRHE